MFNDDLVPSRAADRCQTTVDMDAALDAVPTPSVRVHGLWNRHTKKLTEPEESAVLALLQDPTRFVLLDATMASLAHP